MQVAADLRVDGRVVNAALLGRVLLTGGFLLAEGTPVGTRTPYTGSLLGEIPTVYWFDTVDNAWYSASTGGACLAYFPGV